MYKPLLTTALLASLALGCGVNSKNVDEGNTTTTAPTEAASTSASAEGEAGTATTATPVPTGKIADAATIISRKQVPILCYHQIREWRASDSKSAKDYICPTSTFVQQMKMLADSGYHAITADQLYAT
jgi:hypothetical protein